MADTSHIPGYEPFPINYLFEEVEITMEQYHALPKFDDKADIGTRMKWSHDTFVVTKISDTTYQFNRVKA